MFLKIGKIKEIMKAALKAGGLTVGNYDGHYLVCTDRWGVWVDCEYATNKFKAAIMEVVGELPVETCCLFELQGGRNSEDRRGKRDCSIRKLEGRKGLCKKDSDRFMSLPPRTVDIPAA